MADPTYTPPEVWTHDAENGGRFASINRPTAGARQTSPLPSAIMIFSFTRWPRPMA